MEGPNRREKGSKRNDSTLLFSGFTCDCFVNVATKKGKLFPFSVSKQQTNKKEEVDRANSGEEET